jgi:hypothetical protein
MPERNQSMAEYEALANLSVPRVDTDEDGKKSRTATLVEAGQVVELDKDVADRFLSRHGVPVIRAASDRGRRAPRVTARDLVGKRPGPPADALPDPEGATKIIEQPEANDPKPDTTPGGRRR